MAAETCITERTTRHRSAAGQSDPRQTSVPSLCSNLLLACVRPRAPVPTESDQTRNLSQTVRGCCENQQTAHSVAHQQQFSDSKSTCQMVNSPKVKPSCCQVQSYSCCQICWQPPETAFYLCQKHVFDKWRGITQKFTHHLTTICLVGSWPFVSVRWCIGKLIQKQFYNVLTASVITTTTATFSSDFTGIHITYRTMCPIYHRKL